MSNNGDIVKKDGAAVEANPGKYAISVVKDVKPLLQRAVPKCADSARFMTQIVMAYQAAPGLMKCEPGSQKLAILLAAATGLELGDEVFLIPRWNGKAKRNEANCQIGYKGWLQLLRRSGNVAIAYARDVCERDEFELDLGADVLRHVPPKTGLRGKRIGCYAVIKMTSGERFIDYMTVEEIEEHRLATAPRSKDGGVVTTPAWQGHGRRAMELKTVFLRCKQFAPRSREIALGDAVEAGAPVHVDETTGELEPMPVAIEAIPDEPSGEVPESRP